MLNDTNFYKLCRTCLSSGEMKSLYDNCSTEVCLAEMLMVCTAVKCMTNDGLPAQICNNCSSEITQLYKFTKKCENSDKKLRNFMNNKHLSQMTTTYNQKLQILNNINVINERLFSTVNQSELNTQNDITQQLRETENVLLGDPLIATDLRQSLDVVEYEIKIEINTENDQLDPLEVTNDQMQFDSEYKAPEYKEVEMLDYAKSCIQERNEPIEPHNNIESQSKEQNGDTNNFDPSPQQYECRICSNTFKSYMLLLNHYRRVKHKNMNEYCVVCLKEFASECMYTHVKFHSESEVNKMLEVRHRNHIKMEHEQIQDGGENDQLDPLEVTNDQMQFDSEYKAPEYKEEEMLDYAKSCIQERNEPIEPHNNIESQSKEQNGDTNNFDPSSQQYECRICSNTFKSYMLLLNHYRRVKHKNMNEYCVVCLKEFASECMYTHVKFHSESEVNKMLEVRHRNHIKMEHEQIQDGGGAIKLQLATTELRDITNSVSINETEKKILPEINNAEFRNIYNNDEASDDSICYDTDEDPDYDYFQNQTTDSESKSIQESDLDTSMENVIVPTRSKVLNSEMNTELVETESSTKKSGLRIRGKDFCFFCETYILNFSRHIYRNHSNEMEVAEILAIPSKSKKRKDMLTHIRKKGNYLINSDKCKKPMKKVEFSNETKFLPCTHCLGFYSAKYLWRHRKFCTQNSSNVTGKAQSDGQNYLTRHLTIYEEIRDTVFPRMRPDNISLVAKKDPLICAFGARYIRIHREKHFINVVSRKMRELAKLLIELKKIDNSIKNLFSALQPKYFDSFIAATKTVAKYDTEKECFKSPTYAMNLSTSLKQCCEIAILFCLKGKDIYATMDAAEAEASLKTMIQLLDSHWKYEISNQAHDDLNSKKWNKISYVPLASDLKLLKDYLTVQSNNAASRLITDNNDVDAYSTLIETVYCRIILLNRKRPGELQRINIHVYESVMKDNTQNYEEFSDTVSPTEKILMNHFKPIVIRGKRGRGVPVLLSPDVQEHIRLMIKYRANFIPKENDYLFGKPKLNTPICGYKTITKYATNCGANNPNAITCTRLRKYLATITQIFNMSNNDVDQLATFMGHTSDVHRKAYRLPDDVYQTAKISKLLLLMEKGATNEYKGKSIDEIDINLDEDLLEYELQDTEEDPNVIADQITEHKNTIIEAENTKEKKKRILTPWTKQQKMTVEKFFEKHIKNQISPKKVECDILREQHPELLINKDWLKIKVYIQNKYTK